MDFVPVAMLALLCIALHREILRQWWSHEDGIVLLFAIGRKPLELLFRPEVWQELSSAGFFPLLPLSFRLDVVLAGLSPRFAYAHQLLSLFVAATLFYFFIRGFADRVISTAASAALVAMPLTALIVRQGMVRNYLEGLLLSCAALLLWRRKTRGAVAGAALLWIAATLCKEAWLLLPLIMAADSVARGERLRDIGMRGLPLVAAAAIYVPWRTWMLGSSGGYRTFPSLASLSELPSVFWNAMTLSTPAAWRTVWGLSLILLAAAAALAFRQRGALVGALSLTAAAAPFVPVSDLFFSRYGFVMAVVILGLAAGAASRARRPVAWLAMGAILGAAAAGGYNEARSETRVSRVMGTIGKYVFFAPEGALPLLAPTYGPHVEGIMALRHLLGRGEPPRVFLSEWAFILEDDLPAEIATVDASGPRIVKKPTADFIERSREAAEQYRPSDPLMVEISRENTMARWKFSPPGAKRWNWLTWPLYEVRGVEEEGWLRQQRTQTLPGWPTEGFRIRRIAPDGTWTVSPVFRDEIGTTTWSRDSSPESIEGAQTAGGLVSDRRDVVSAGSESPRPPASPPKQENGSRSPLH